MSGQTSTQQSSFLAVALNTEGGAAPDWIELIPAGADVVGRDRRSWKNPDPQAVVDASDAGAQPIPLDWEHAIQERATKGEEAPAAAWIDQLEVRNGAIWAHVEWTPRARDQVANKEYRFVSPVFTYDRTSRVIGRLVSAGLTQLPNLPLTALNREEPHREPSETPLTTLAERLRQAYGLAADATDDAIVTAATTSIAANKAGVDLTQFAPRADLDTAVNRATTAEAKLQERVAADHDKAIEAALDGAQAEGKITPASRPAYLAMCKAEGGLERFTELAKTLSVIASNRRTGAEEQPRQGAAAGDHGLTETELAVCRQLGQTPEAYAKSKKEG